MKKKKPPYRASGRERARVMARRRDNYTCQECGLVRTPEMVLKSKGLKSLDVHHTNGLCGTVSKGYDPVSALPILITLCHKCHYNRHDFNKISKARMSGNRRGGKRGNSLEMMYARLAKFHEMKSRRLKATG